MILCCPTPRSIPGIITGVGQKYVAISLGEFCEDWMHNKVSQAD